MKILNLTFKNLNSIYDEWSIDFTNPEYTNNGIFCITGSTGAGKSTILDAICLALYGKTPRLSRVNDSQNDIMSRQTGHCFSEVEFRVQGKTYRARWEQQRARKKIEGDLQPRKHELYNENKEIISENVSKTIDKIVEITGMNFDQFSRSMLLAQGAFDTFLKANNTEKSAVLEQITGSEIYSKISKKVLEKRNAENQELAQLKNQIDGINVLTLEDELERKNSLEKNKEELVSLSAMQKSTSEAIIWLKDIATLTNNLNDISNKQTSLSTQLTEFAPDRAKLKRAIEASSLDGIYTKLKGEREQLNKFEKDALENGQKLPQLIQNNKNCIDNLTQANDFKTACAKALEDSKEIFKFVREKDAEISIIQHKIDGINKDINGYLLKEKELDDNKNNAQKRLNFAQETKEELSKYLEDNKTDKWLVEGLSGVEANLNQLKAKKTEITTKNEKLKTETENLNKAKNKHQQLADKVKEAQLKITGAENIFNACNANLVLISMENLNKELELAYRERTVANFEEQRKLLPPNTPCPLCGSTDHPYVTNMPYQISDIEKNINEINKKIKAAEQLNDNKQSAEDEVQKAKDNYHKIVIDLEKNSYTHIDNIISNLNDELDNLNFNYKKLHDDLKAKLNVEEILDSTLSTLKAKQSRWIDYTNKLQNIDKEIISINAELKKYAELIAENNDNQTNSNNDLTKAKAEESELVAERKEKFGDKIVDTEENLLSSALKTATKDAEESSRLQGESLQKLTTANTIELNLKNQINAIKLELSKTEIEFNEELAKLKFANENELKDATISSEERKKLTAKQDTLDEEQTGLNAQKQRYEQDFGIKIALNLTSKSIEELETEAGGMLTRQSLLNNENGRLASELDNNCKNKESISHLKTQIESKDKECTKWELMYELIGSSSGNKFRNFAQGLTFEIMVNYANEQLEKMSNRYLLIHDRNLPLQLNVIDNYQAGEIRPTTNLSGGESFIVSLALALGLSSMSSKNFSADSLFLDEGFGTLDSESLDTALNALSSLHHEGKLIGIISHVEALKGRINTQINVEGNATGRSTISGPGVERIS